MLTIINKSLQSLNYLIKMQNQLLQSGIGNKNIHNLKTPKGRISYLNQ